MLIGWFRGFRGLYGRHFAFYKYCFNKRSKLKNKWDFRDFVEVKKWGDKFKDNLIDFVLF